MGYVFYRYLLPAGHSRQYLPVRARGWIRSQQVKEVAQPGTEGDGHALLFLNRRRAGFPFLQRLPDESVDPGRCLHPLLGRQQGKQGGQHRRLRGQRLPGQRQLVVLALGSTLAFTQVESAAAPGNPDTRPAGLAPGPPLVLLHGGSSRWQTFEAILPELAVSYHIYAPDLRGHGQSEWQPGSYRLQDYAADVVAFLQARVEQPAFIFGHSLGGMIAVLVSARLPGAVRALVVGDSPLSAAPWQAHLAKTREQLVAWRALAGGQKMLPDLIAILKDTPMEVPGREERVPMRQVFGEDSARPCPCWRAPAM